MLAVLVLLAALGAAPGEAAPSPVLRDPLPCPTEAQVRAALSRRAPGLSGEVTLRAPQPGQLEVGWVTGGRRFSRVLPLSPGECVAAAQTVALLLQSWQRALPTAAAEDPLTQAAKVDAAHRRTAPDAGAPATPAPTEPLTPSLAPEPDAGTVDRAMIDSSTTPPVDAGPSIAVPLVEPAPSNTPEPSPTAETPPGPSLLHLALGLDGRASAGLDVQRGAAGAAAALALGIGERWGVEAQVAADLPFTASAAEGGAQLARQTLALRGLLRLQLASGPRVALRLEAGPLLERVSASSSGYAVTRSTAVLDVGLELALALELRLGRRVALELGPALQGMAHRSRFVVENVGPIVTLPSVWGGLAAGVRFDFL